ncbi:unnamed protein product [Cuscuta campestris]|uniref:Coiled-coil domain-containing protein SCD2 n=1 Tax=Cuscuta campestris TaxID=132261 RepID=A0A484N1W3_9ASTE|nr:unnamed protein product [Cuscuta campestris]
MDRTRHVYAPQKSVHNAPGSGAPPSPGELPARGHVRSGSAGVSNARRPQTTIAAAQRLAQVMSHQATDDDDEDEDDLLYDFSPANSSAGLGLAGERTARSRSPMAARTSMENHASARSVIRMRPSPSVGSLEQQSSGDHSTLATRSSLPSPLEKPSSDRSASITRSYHMRSPEQPPSAHSTSAARSTLGSIQQPPPVRPISVRSSQLSSSDQPLSARSFLASSSSMSTNAVEHVQPPSARSAAGRSSHPMVMDQPPSARSTSAARLNLGPKTISILPSSVPISLRTAVQATSSELQSEDPMDNKRSTTDLGTSKYKETVIQHSSSDLQDEVDMLQEENESLLEKIRLAEERSEEAEARARLLEKQIANLGEGVSLEARLLARKEAALQQREAALKAASQNHGEKGVDSAALRAEAGIARDEANSATEQLHEFECEVKSIRTMSHSHRMILSQEEMEEVILKRCWLARYWGLCVHHGIHADIAESKHEYWSSFSHSPNEVVLEAGQRAKTENSLVYSDMEEGEEVQRGVEILSDGNVESMILVEKGLLEQTSLKVAEAIALAMAQQRRSGGPRSSATDDLKVPIEGQNFADAFELSQEEAEDVRFKQAWLIYFWRRAKNHGLEPDIADERLEFWINIGTTHPINSHDAVNVERGLMELKKLGIEAQLFEATRTTCRSRNHPQPAT